MICEINLIMSLIDKMVNEYKGKIGTISGISNWFKIDQEIINSFADITMDNQFIHIDNERAIKETPFGSTIAHGFLILSLSTKFFVDSIDTIKNEKMGINYGFNKIRFVNPVKCNDKIRGVFKLKNVEIRSESNILFNYDLTIEIKGIEKPAIVCEWLNLSVIK